MRRQSGQSASCSRRTFLAGSAGCGAYALGLLAVSPFPARRRLSAPQFGEVIVTEPFGRLEKLGEGVWALVSTPLEARTTLCNGGIIAGDQGVLAVEGFASVEGARWLASTAASLTGRRPTHVVLTHFHSDHSTGLPGYRQDGVQPIVSYTPTTRSLLEESLRDRPATGAESPLGALAPEGAIPDAGGPVEIDLGGRTVRIDTRLGHTPSDLTLEIDDPHVVFCGDLVWNRMFPNYVDAIPSRLSTACKELLADSASTYVPGHGPLADRDEIRTYINVIEDVGGAARAAFERGARAEDAAAEYHVPRALGEWYMFSPRYYEVAFDAWYRELAGLPQH